MNSITVSTLVATFALTLSTFSARAADRPLDCKGDDIILVECQMDTITKGMASDPMVVGAIENMKGELTPSEEELNNGVTVVKATSCDPLEVTLLKDRYGLSGFTTCRVEIKIDGQAKNQIKTSTVRVAADIVNLYESYYPVVRSVRVTRVRVQK